MRFRIPSHSPSAYRRRVANPWVYGGDHHWQREGVGYIHPVGFNYYGDRVYNATSWRLPSEGGGFRAFRYVRDAKAWLDERARKCRS